MADEPTQVAAETQGEQGGTPPAAPVAATPDYSAQLDEIRAQNAQLVQQIQTLSQLAARTPIPAAPQAEKDLTDEDLWSQAQQGNRRAFEMYQERIADRRVNQRMGEAQRDGAVRGQLTALYAQYPELRDANHPLTQRALAFKTVLTQMGSPANALQTDLDAILRAVADSRAVLAKPAAVAPSQRAASVTGQMGAMHAQASRAAATEPLTDKDVALAKRMGIKDPVAAKKRFDERQNKGLSSVSPLVAVAVREAQG